MEGRWETSNGRWKDDRKITREEGEEERRGGGGRERWISVLIKVARSL